MKDNQGSILAQTLINLMIFALFMQIAFQSMVVLSKPVTINHLKYEYLQLQLQYLASLNHGVTLNNDAICFKKDHCLEISNDRLILTPGYQILLENIQSHTIIDLDDSIQLRINHLNEWITFNVRK